MRWLFFGIGKLFKLVITWLTRDLELKIMLRILQAKIETMKHCMHTGWVPNGSNMVNGCDYMANEENVAQVNGRKVK